MNIDWSMIFGAIGLLGNFAAIAYTAGVASTRLTAVEKDLEKMEQEVRDFRALKEDLAVVKSQLVSINELLHRAIQEKSQSCDTHY